MIFPTRRDASAIVCCEASAFGLPQIVSDVGGLAVRNGENGIRLPAAASGSDYAAAISELGEDRNRYFTLACSRRGMFEASLKWGAGGRSKGRGIHPLLKS